MLAKAPLLRSEYPRPLRTILLLEESRVSLRWRTVAEGGRASGPPPGPTYRPTVVFVLGEDAEVVPGWPATGEHFSVSIRFSASPSRGQGPAHLRFLNTEAASELASMGGKFFVMEGPRVVAYGVILELPRIS